MKTTIIKIVIVTLVALLSLSCATNSRIGSANDRTGTNGATNGTGKIPKSGSVHNYSN